MIKNKTAIIGDVHSHHHDPQAYQAALDFVAQFKPETLVFNGDIFDFESPSSYTKRPETLLRLQEEIDIGVELIARMCRAAPKAKKIFIGGNHEDRLRRLLCNKAQALLTLDCLTFEKLLSLDKLGFETVLRYGKRYKHHGILIEHGDPFRKGSGSTARAMIDLRGMSGVSGHCHRLAKVTKNNEGGRIFWIESGCLCGLNPGYIQGKPDWSHGFSIGYTVPGHGFEAFPVEIVDGVILY